MPLTEREMAILDFEGSWWTIDGDKDALVVDRFDLAPDRYASVVHELVSRPESLEYRPLVVLRVLRERDRNRRARSTAAAAQPIDRGLV
jgi:hypothetical protein